MLKKLSYFTSLILLATSAHADLNIINNTDFDSTCVVNDGMCSNQLGDEGITHAHSANLISQLELYIACGSNTWNCKADVYMTPDCSGPSIGTVILDINQGISQVTETGPYKIVALDPFQVQINPA